MIIRINTAKWEFNGINMFLLRQKQPIPFLQLFLNKQYP